MEQKFKLNKIEYFSKTQINRKSIKNSSYFQNKSLTSSIAIQDLRMKYFQMKVKWKK